MLNLLTDQPIGEGLDVSTDGLGFKTYANVLAQAARDTEGPFTIGIFGEWGSGKTSLMRMIEQELNKKGNDNADIITVWFNAWRFEKEEHPLIPLVASITRGIEGNKTLMAKIGEKGKKWLQSLRAVAYGVTIKAPIMEVSMKDILQNSAQFSDSPLNERSLYCEAFESLSNTSLGEKVKVVVLIDDLDRCFPDLAIRLLESIKLVLCQPNFIFVIGVARAVIEGYLKHRYSTKYGLQDFRGQAYLDKIVQLPFYIPPHT